MQIKLNADFTIDNAKLSAGIQEVTPAQYELLKGIDVKGMPIVTREQTPLVTLPGNGSEED